MLGDLMNKKTFLLFHLFFIPLAEKGYLSNNLGFMKKRLFLLSF